MKPVSRHHFGHFDGWTGSLGGIPVELVLPDNAEEAVYVAVRYMVPVYSPRLVLYLGEGTAVCENLRGGDVSLVAEARRVFGPVVVADNMFPPGRDHSWPDELIFPDGEIRREVLTHGPVTPDSVLLRTALETLNPITSSLSIQNGVETVRAGSGLVKNWSGRAGELLRRRFAVDIVDRGAYGVLSASAELSVAALAMLVTSAGKSGEVAREYERRSRHYVKAAAEMVRILVPPALSAVALADPPS